MKVPPEQLEAELLQLPPHVRARLAETLLASLDEADSELDVAWGEEAGRRADELRSSQVAPVPATEAKARARSQLR